MGHVHGLHGYADVLVRERDMTAYFYRAMLYMLTIERQIARSTGRNPANIAHLSSEIQEYQLLILKHELNAADAAERI